VDATGTECALDIFYDADNGFYGIISPVPIHCIYFNEAAGGDDMALGDLFFGYRTD